MPGSRPLARPLDLVRRLRRQSGSRPTLAPRRTKARNLGALLGGLAIGGLAMAVPAAVAAPTSVVDLGRGIDLRGAERRLRRQHRQRRRRPAHHAPRRPRREGERAADRLPPGRRHRHDRGRQRRRRRRLTPTSSRRTPRSPLGRAAPRSRARSPARRIPPGPAHHRRRRVEHRNGDPRRRGRPERRLRLPGHGAMALAAGSHVVLTNGAQASRVFWQVNGAGADRRARRFRGHADGARRGRDGQRDRGQRPRVRPQRRPHARRQRVLQRPARGHDRRWGHRDHDRHDPDDQRHDRRRGAGGRHRDGQRADPHRDPRRWRVVGDLGDPGERHLPGRRLGHATGPGTRAAPPSS